MEGADVPGEVFLELDSRHDAEVTVGRPPDGIPGPDDVLTMTGAGLQLDLPDTFVGYDVDALLPVLEVLAAAVSDTHLRFVMPGLGFVGDDNPLTTVMFPAAPATQQFVQDLRRMQEATGSLLRFPANVTNGDVEDLRRLVRTMDGETVEHDGGLRLNIRPEALADFLETWNSAPQDGSPGGFLAATDRFRLQVGDLTLPYGPAALWAPMPRLTNLDELQAMVREGVPNVAAGIAALVDPTDHPFVWVSQEQAIAYLDSGQRPKSLGD